ncbi:MAG: hypothetical protein HRT98_03245 [Mycoplasmatales bacterium]|nr:hypothetical protein [Mycoplasmatales bacterium]
MKKLKWTYNFYTKYILLIFNIISLSIIFSVSLPIIFQGKTWFWIFFLPGLVTSLKILNIVFIKKESISLIVRWSAIISIGIIPLIFGVIFHQDILIAGCAWILVWEFTNEIWDIFIVKLLLKQKNRELSYYPLLPIILFIYLMGILIWLISNTFIDAVPSNPFKNDEDD